jgi:hypothetical protein
MAPPLLPVTRLVVCSRCSEHVKSSDPQCPHCGAPIAGPGMVRAAAVAVMAGLLSACPVAEPAYGVVVGSDSDILGTDTETGTGTTAAEDTTTGSPTTGSTGTGEQTSTGTGTGSSDDSGTDTDPTGGMTTAEPEYGVPGTTTAEPDYGVPGTTTAEPDYGVPGTTAA